MHIVTPRSWLNHWTTPFWRKYLYPGHCWSFIQGMSINFLKNLPTAIEMAELMFNHIFYIFSIQENKVFHRGPQFVWRSFFSLLLSFSLIRSFSLPLSSGYNPRTNRQMKRKIQEIGCFLRTLMASPNFLGLTLLTSN